MSGGVKLFLFTLLIPFFAGLGHDVYQNYFSDDQKIRAVKRMQFNFSDFMASDLGWVWNEYFPGMMAGARNMVEPEIWQSQVDPILQMSTMTVGLIPFIFGCIYLVFAYILGAWPFSQYRQSQYENEDDYAVYKHAKSKTTKYSKR